MTEKRSEEGELPENEESRLEVEQEASTEPKRAAAEERSDAATSGAEAAGADEAASDGADEKLLERVRGAVEGLFDRLGADVEVQVMAGDQSLDCSLRVGERDAVLHAIPQDELFEAAEYLLQRMVYRDADAGKRIVLHLGSVTATDDPAMEEMARRLGSSVARMKQPITIVPISARDRKAIHQALDQDEETRTRSEGEGLLRRLVIEPK